MSNLKEKAQDYFDRFTTSDECHITSDARVFHTRGTADSFASGLPDTEVKTFTRKDFEAEQIEVDAEVVTLNAPASTEATDAASTEAPATDTASTEAPATDTANTEAPATEPLTGDAKLLAFDTNVASYPELKAMALEFGITTASLKAVDLIPAIVAAQETLKSNV